MFTLKAQIMVLTPLYLAFLGGVSPLLGSIALGQVAPAVVLHHPSLTESSGLSVSSDGKFVFTHNDSGDQPRLFIFGRDGQFLTEAMLVNAQAIDWEDMCSFSFQGQDYLAIGDVGDNLRKRNSVTVYIVKQPILEQAKAKSLLVSVDCELTVTFDVGPINCEALAYDPRRQSLVFMSKEPLRCRLFEVELAELQGKQERVAQYRQSFFVPLVTGADISRDGKRLVMCSYAAGTMAVRDGDQGGLWKLEAAGGVFSLPVRRQGESICFSADGERLLLTSEFAPTPLFDVPCPTFQNRSP